MDPAITELKNLNYEADTCLYFQRLSVIISDLLFCFGCFRICTAICGHGNLKVHENRVACTIFFLSYFNVGLLMLDNIHFQYNSMMYGIMLLSIAYIIEGKLMKSAAIYAVLLNFKHIYLYSAPAFGIFYIRSLILDERFDK